MHAPAGRHRALDGDGGFQVDAGLLGRGVDRRRAGCEMIEPGAGLVAERPPEIPDRPVTGGIAAEKRHLDHVIRHIGMGDALFREQQVVQVIVVDDHRALGPQELHPVGLAERRVAGWQGIAHPEIDHRAIRKGHDRPGHVVGAVSRCPEYPMLSAGNHLDWTIAFQEPAHEIHVIGEDVENRRRVWIALEDRESLGARVVDPSGAADDFAEATVAHLLLGAQEAVLVAAAVTDPQTSLALPDRFEDPIRVAERERDRFFDQHRLAERERPADRGRVLAFGRRDDHRGDLGVGDHVVVASGVEIGAGRIGKGPRACRIAIGNRQKSNRRMLGREPRAQGPDASGADDANSDIGSLHYATCNAATARWCLRTRASSTSMPSPGRSGTSTCPWTIRSGWTATSSTRPFMVSVRPHPTAGSAAAMWRAAAEAMLDSPVLHETLTSSPSRSHKSPASITARMPPSLMAFRLAPRAALQSWWRRMSSS